jgi:hypothetical protein
VTMRSDTLLIWTARVLGVLVCAFLSLFALDAFGGGKCLLEALPAFLIHVAPMALLLIVVVLSWRWEWVGGVVFTGLAFAYAYKRAGMPRGFRRSPDLFSSSVCCSSGVGFTVARRGRPNETRLG